MIRCKRKSWESGIYFADYGLQSFIRTLIERFSRAFRNGKKIKYRRTQEEADQIGLASDILQISEFQFFRIAYSHWFGMDIPIARLECIFAEYVFKEIVPYWVRHLSRRVMKKSDLGVIDPSEFYIIPPKGTRKLRIEGYIYTIIILIFTIVFCIGAIHFTPY